LEEFSVSPKTRARYLEVWGEILCFARSVNLDATVETDEVLTRWLDKRFLEGWNIQVANFAVASTKFMLPRFARHGGAALPRSLLALRGWKRKAPAHSRLPLPYEAVALIATKLWEKGCPWMAAYVLLNLTAYLRPSEALKLHREDMVAPSGGRYLHWSVVLHPREKGMASKTQEYDEVVLLDQPDHKFLDKLWRAVWDGTSPGTKIFGFSQSAVAQMFTTTALEAGLGILRPVLYQLRHTGPSMDIATGRRSIEGVRARGRWRSDRSCLRYTKEGRVNEQLQRLDPAVRKAALEAHGVLVSLLRKRCADFSLKAKDTSVQGKSSSRSSQAKESFHRA
jgi:integrase